MSDKKNCITRRNWLQRTAAAAGGLLLSQPGRAESKSSMGDDAAPAPNIVLIISDDQGWGDYGFMGHRAIQTPNLDRLASESIVFTRGYVAAPLCCPSLASIVTGLHPHQHKITSNDPPYLGKGERHNTSRWPPERLQLRSKMIAHIDEAPTLPAMLKQVGYQSLQTGKWWLGRYSRGGFTHGMTHGDPERGGRHGDEGLTIGRKTMQPIYDFIDAADQQPFFLWYAPFLPHAPHNPPERLLEKYRQKTDSIHIARYWANCEWFDETCGLLLEYLDKKGIADNTVVLYVCDNGWTQKKNQGGYAEKSKRSPYDGGVRTPIIVRWPGHAAPRFDESTVVSAIDLAPTILESCGLKPTPQMQGINLLDAPALKKRNSAFGAAYTHDAVDIDQPMSNLKYSYLIEGDWKLILPSGRNETGSEAELYNIIQDPNETKNLADSNAEKVKQMSQRLQKWLHEAGTQ